MEKYGDIKVAGPKATIPISDKMKEILKEKGLKVLEAVRDAVCKAKNIIGWGVVYVAERGFDKHLTWTNFLKMKERDKEKVLSSINGINIFNSASWNASSVAEIEKIISEVFKTFDSCIAHAQQPLIKV